jgi:hypothetical protein
MEKLIDRMPGAFSVELVQYSSALEMTNAADRLYHILTTSTGTEDISPDQFQAVLAYSTPIVAIDDHIITAGSLPPLEELARRLQAA